MQARLTNGVSTAGIYRTCVPAGAFNTLVWVSTVSVSDAGGDWCHFGFTFTVRTNESVLRTGAEDSSDGRAVLHPTYLSVVTGTGGLTRVLALVVDAGNAGPAVIINPALHLHLCGLDAGDEAIAPGANVTSALRLVVGGRAGGVLSTGPGQTDWATGLAQEVTGLVLSAVIVSATLHVDTGHQGVALQSLTTHTLRLMELYQTLGTSPARPG